MERTVDVAKGKLVNSEFVSVLFENDDFSFDEANDFRWNFAYANVEDIEEIRRLFGESMKLINITKDEFEVAKCLVQINFASMNRCARESEENFKQKNYGKAKRWTDRECSEFLETHLLPALLERFIIIGDDLYFKEIWGYWRRAGSVSTLRKITTLAALMLEPLPLIPSSRSVTNLFNSVRMFAEKSVIDEDTTIQFNDCVITSDCELTQDPPTTFPRFIFDFDIWDTVNSEDSVPEVDDLILHLANGDKEVAQCLLDRLSMTFVINAAKKNLLEPKVILLYDPTGENGKSTFANLLMRALRNENCASFSFSTFCNYELAKLRNNILLIDADASSVHVSPEVSTAIKTAVTADSMTVRRIYHDPESVRPLCQFLICTNAMPKAEDKTRGWDRRLEWYEVKEKLVREKAWFEVLNSREAADYLLAKLIKNAVRIAAAGKPIHQPDVVRDANTAYSNLNKNVRPWIAAECSSHNVERLEDVFDRMPSAKVYEDYKTWCLENAETPLGITNFNAIIGSETPFVKKYAQITPDKNPEAFSWWQEHTSTPDKFTATKALVMCWVRENG